MKQDCAETQQSIPENRTNNSGSERAQDLAFSPSWKRICPYVLQVPGFNPGANSLSGTNIYIIGKGKQRLMIDTGEFPEKNQESMLNLSDLLDKEDISIKSIFLCHGIRDHFGGTNCVLKMHQQKNLPLPKVYKKVDGNSWEREVLDRFPLVEENLQNINEGERFFLDENEEGITDKSNDYLEIIETPGHRPDHLSYGLYTQEQNILFPGDHILGTQSVSFENLTDYMNSLYKLRNKDFDKIYLAHSYEQTIESIVVTDVKKKMDDYVDYRQSRMNQMSKIIQEQITITVEEIFDNMYSKIIKERGGSGSDNQKLVNLCNTNLETVIQYFVDQKMISRDGNVINWLDAVST